MHLIPLHIAAFEWLTAIFFVLFILGWGSVHFVKPPHVLPAVIAIGSAVLSGVGLIVFFALGFFATQHATQVVMNETQRVYHITLDSDQATSLLKHNEVQLNDGRLVYLRENSQGIYRLVEAGQQQALPVAVPLASN